MIPTMIEEGLASVRGAKLAKKVLSPEMLKKVKTANFRAWTTYFVSTSIAAGLAKAAIYVRDKVANNRNN